MIKGICFATVLLSFAVNAQEAQTCAEFSSASGTLIEFKTDDLYKKYGFQMFREQPSGHSAMPYESLAGRKGKVVGGQSGQYGIAFYHRVLLDDCRTVYWYDTDKHLEVSDEMSGAVRFIDRPPTTWRMSERTDRMTDAKSCVVTPEADTPYPMFFFHSVEGPSVGVVGGDFPGRPVTFRVDTNKAISEEENLTGARARQLVDQIRSGGKQLLVGSYEWPDDFEVVNEFNLQGLVEQLDRCRELGHR